jgi:hypothetical protein
LWDESGFSLRVTKKKTGVKKKAEKRSEETEEKAELM